MTVSYTVIFSRFLAKIKDYSFLILPECEANEFMTEWLHSTISKPHVRKLFTSFSSDDEIHIIIFVDAVVHFKIYFLDFIIRRERSE